MKSRKKSDVDSNKAKLQGESTIGDEPRRPGKALPRGAISSTLNERNLQERIAERAYELYLQRGQVQGHAVDDWLEAERQVLTQPEISPCGAKIRKPRKGLKHSD